MKRAIFFGMLIAVCFCTVFDADAVVITYTYDEAGRLTQAGYGAGKSIAYTYDNAGNMLNREALGGSNVRGDVNGSLTLADVIASLQIQSGKSLAANLPAADINGDGKIGSPEAVYVLKYLANPM
ncbi:MAG: hypothetical protein BWK80_62085 [Desulfobacteraceae bacterium IS3]|nr:MAG: hypothetical protein BWK80_62085 [Desulfobacteraceae bacterium IS3]